MPGRPRVQRVLAIDPYSRGFGFVLLEGADRLVDWGLKDVRDEKVHQTLAKLGELITLYEPTVLVIEDCAHPASRRCERIVDLIGEIIGFAHAKGLRTKTIAVTRVHAVFAMEGVSTKHGINGVIAQRFPELGRHRPKFRKPWMSEDERQAIFDAAALAWLRSPHPYQSHPLR
jgi:hypothetical protein